MLPELLAYEPTIVKATRDLGGWGWWAYNYGFKQLAVAKSQMGPKRYDLVECLIPQDKDPTGSE